MRLYQAFLKPSALSQAVFEESDIWEIQIDTDALEVVHNYMDGAEAATESFRTGKALIKAYTALVKQKLNQGYRYENCDPEDLDELIDFAKFTLDKPKSVARISLDTLSEQFGEKLPSDLIKFIENGAYLKFEGKQVSYGEHAVPVHFFVKSLFTALKDEDVKWVLESWERLQASRMHPIAKPNTLIPFAKFGKSRAEYTGFVYIDYIDPSQYCFRILDEEGSAFDIMDVSTIEEFITKYVVEGK